VPGGRIDEGKLPENLSRSEDPEHPHVAERVVTRTATWPLAEEMQRVPRVTLVEDDLVPDEAPPPPDRQQVPAVLLGQQGEERRVHAEVWPRRHGHGWPPLASSSAQAPARRTASAFEGSIG